MNITGTYISNNGEIIFQQEGNNITGTYSSIGTIKGEMNNNILTAVWTNNGVDGLLEFTFSEDGSFKGKYKKGINEGAMRGSWNGEKIKLVATNSNSKLIVSNPNNYDTINLDQNVFIAAKLILLHQQASPSLIDRKLNIGYERSNLILKQLEILGVISELNQTKSRDILIEDEEEIEYIERKEDKYSWHKENNDFEAIEWGDYVLKGEYYFDNIFFLIKNLFKEGNISIKKIIQLGINYDEDFGLQSYDDAVNLINDLISLNIIGELINENGIRKILYNNEKSALEYIESKRSIIEKRGRDLLKIKENQLLNLKHEQKLKEQEIEISKLKIENEIKEKKEEIINLEEEIAKPSKVDIKNTKEQEKLNLEKEKNKERRFEIHYSIKLTANKTQRETNSFLGLLKGGSLKVNVVKEKKGDFKNKSMTVRFVGQTLPNNKAKYFVERNDSDIKNGNAGSSTIVIRSIKEY